jgi:hypothetical protein
MDADDLCAYEPQGRALVHPMVNLVNAAPHWSPEAEQRLSRVPDFLRPMVKKRAEAHVSGLGENRVTVRHLSDLSAARFGPAGPPKFFVDGARPTRESEKA